MAQQNNQPPVSEGQTIDVLIESVGDKGDGVAKVQGFVIFVAGTKKGETCKIQITRVSTNVAFAKKIGDASSAQAPEEIRNMAHEDPIEKIDYDNLGEGSEDFGEVSEEPEEKEKDKE